MYSVGTETRKHPEPRLPSLVIRFLRLPFIPIYLSSVCLSLISLPSSSLSLAISLFVFNLSISSASIHPAICLFSRFLSDRSICISIFYRPDRRVIFLVLVFFSSSSLLFLVYCRIASCFIITFRVAVVYRVEDTWTASKRKTTTRNREGEEEAEISSGLKLESEEKKKKKKEDKGEEDRAIGVGRHLPLLLPTFLVNMDLLILIDLCKNLRLGS